MSQNDETDPLELNALNSYSPESDLFANDISNVTVPSRFCVTKTFSYSLRGMQSFLHWTLGCGSPSTFAIKLIFSPSLTCIFEGSFILIHGFTESKVDS